MESKIPDQNAALRQVLNDEALRKQISKLRDERQIVDLVMEAGTRNGFRFDRDWVKQAFDDVRLIRPPARLSEKELFSLAIAGDSDGGTSANKLCHTISCGGHPKTCC